MSKVTVAITDTVFPDWKPAEEALSALDVELIRAETPEQDAILAVAQHAEAVFVTYAGRWEMPAVVPIRRFRGRTLGLVGIGNIAQAIAGKAQAFGIKTIAADPYAPDEVFAKMHTERVQLDELYERSDYISVHAPLTPETERMFSTEAFGKMKSDALLINTSRGPVVDVDALVKALDAGEIGGVALDVLPQEPPAADHPLLGRDNVILTPHTAFYSEDALLDLQTTVATDVATVLGGGKPKYPVNPTVLGG